MVSVRYSWARGELSSTTAIATVFRATGIDFVRAASMPTFPQPHIDAIMPGFSAVDLTVSNSLSTELSDASLPLLILSISTTK